MNTESLAKKKIAAALAPLDEETRQRILDRASAQWNPGDILSALDDEEKSLRASVAVTDAAVADLHHKHQQHEREAAALREQVDALKALEPWASRERFQLERNDCSRLHKLVEAHAAGKVINGDTKLPLPMDHAAWLEEAKPFVVQHDWAAAFANAEEYKGTADDFILPYQLSAFEFRMSGRTVIVVSFQPDPEVVAASPHHLPAGVRTPSLPYVECERGFWFCGGQGAQQSPAMIFAWEQIRAICIALDAEVATHDLVRAPDAVNAKRGKAGKLPLYDYHVVKLRGRITRQQHPYSGSGTHRSPRLHFRRGHWRHYDTHRTWIRWMLVGNPELGFIDKSYRL